MTHGVRQLLLDADMNRYISMITDTANESIEVTVDLER